MPKRVVVAMSGGVDSSVAAYLIKEAGYEAIGIAMQVYDHSNDAKHKFGSCCGISDYDDARMVAEKLDIPYYLLDFEKTFKEEVINNFVQEYKKGRTPIPCIHCNSKVKFHHLFNKAKELGAGFVATGHYAILNKESDGRFHLRKSKDLNKDQTYFLFGLNQEQLGHTLFPVGNLTKEEVRDIARRLNLRTAEKEESVGICFVPDKDYAKFVEKQLPEVKDTNGEIVTTDGKVITQHNGIHNFTVGQRHGLGIATGTPLYVISIDPITNRVVVGNENEVLFKSLIATNVNWLCGDVIPAKAGIQCRVRYRAPDIPCKIESLENHSVRVEFETPVRAVTPGQAAVFYSDNECLGGGWIERAYL